jgi:hypothetical protein
MRIRLEQRVLPDHAGTACDARVQTDDRMTPDAGHAVGGLRHVWTCHGFVPLPVLVQATFRSKATGLFPPGAE